MKLYTWLKVVYFDNLYRKHLLFFFPNDAENNKAEYSVSVFHQTLPVRSIVLAS